MPVVFNPFTGNLDLIDNTAAAGSDTQVQFNDGGVLGGDSGLVFNKATNALTGGSFIPTSSTVPTNGVYSPGANQLAISTNGTGKLFVDADGKVGVNTASEGAQLHVLIGASGKSWTAPTGTSALFERNSINYVTIVAANNNISQLNFADTDDADIGNIKYSHADNSMSFGTNNTERARIDSSGRLLVGTSSDSGGALLQVNGDRIRVGTAKTPASATATGTAGEICWDANYVYVCIATNTWKRSALSTW